MQNVVWRKSNVEQSSWTQVQLTLPVGVNMIHVDAVSGIERWAVSYAYIAIDDFTIVSGNCPQPGRSLQLIQ